MFLSPGSRRTRPPGPSSAAPTVGHPSPLEPPPAGLAVIQPTAPAPRPPDCNVLLAMQIKTVLTRFTTWSRDHAGAPCPDDAALGLVTLDPWGHPIELTCTGQPADQRVGAISAGPDGIAGNGDDVASWAFGREVTDLVRGARWKSTPAAPPMNTPILKHRKERAGAHDHRPATPPTTPAIPPTTSAVPPTSAAPTKPSALSIDAGADDIPARR